jgi:hypothetical protein
MGMLGGEALIALQDSFRWMPLGRRGKCHRDGQSAKWAAGGQEEGGGENFTTSLFIIIAKSKRD